MGSVDLTEIIEVIKTVVGKVLECTGHWSS